MDCYPFRFYQSLAIGQNLLSLLYYLHFSLGKLKYLYVLYLYALSRCYEGKKFHLLFETKNSLNFVNPFFHFLQKFLDLLPVSAQR